MATDLTGVYDALRKADAAGDTAGASKLADYIKSQGAAPPFKNNIVTASPTDGMSGLDKFVAGYGKAGHDLMQGAGQMLGLTSRADVAESRKLDAPLMATGAGKIGSFAGSVMDLLPTAFIPGANSLAGAAAIGAGAGLIQPSTSTPETLANTGLGAAASPLSLLAGRAVGAVGKGLKASLWDPFTQPGQQRIASNVLQNFAGGPKEAQAAAAALSSAPQTLPGVTPTTAELADNAGLAQLQKTLSSNPSLMQDFTQRAQGNRAAMTGALGDIAGTPADRAGAQATRASVTDSMYKAANNVVVPSDPKLESILRRPSMTQAWQRAQQLAAERGDTLTIPDPNAPIALPPSKAAAASGANLDPLTLTQSAPNMMGSVGNPAATSAASVRPMGLPARQSSILDPLSLNLASPAPPQYTGKAIQYLKMSLNDIANAGPQMGMGSHEVGAVKSTLGDLNQWTADNVPKLRMADQIFAKLSQPMNQMDVGQQLSNKLLPSLSDYGANTGMNGASFATALRNGDSIAADVTGNKSMSLANILSDSQMKTIRQIGEQLARSDNAAKLGAPKGSPTAQNLISQNSVGQFLGPFGLPNNMAGRVAGGALGRTVGRPAQWLSGAAEPDILRVLSQAALDPQTARRLLQATQRPGMGQALWNRQGLLGPTGGDIARGLLGDSAQQ